MCNSVYVVNRAKEIGTAREFAEFLGVKPEELLTTDDEPMPDSMEWRDACLCPFDIEANLDAAKLWHRRDVDRDPMRVLVLDQS